MVFPAPARASEYVCTRSARQNARLGLGLVGREPTFALGAYQLVDTRQFDTRPLPFCWPTVFSPVYQHCFPNQ